MGVVAPYNWNHGGEAERAGWMVNVQNRGADGTRNCAMDYTAPLQDDTSGMFAQIAAKRHLSAHFESTSQSQGKREKAQLTSKMLRSLLDELDAEFNIRRDEWNKVHEILSVKVKRLQNSIQLAQRVTATTVGGFETVLRAVLLRSAFCTWDMSHCQYKIRARVRKNVDWWFKDTSESQTSCVLTATSSLESA